MKTQINIKRAYIKAALPFISSDKLRLSMNGLHVDVDGSLTATNGHTLIHFPNEFRANQLGAIVDQPFTIPLDICKELAKGGKKAQAEDITFRFVGCVDGPTVDRHKYQAVTESGIAIPFESLTWYDSFPNWRAIYPSSVTDDPGSYNGKYLNDIEQACEIAANGEPPLIRQNGNKAAVFWTTDRNDYFYGLIMPRLVDSSYWSDDNPCYTKEAIPTVSPKPTANKPEPEPEPLTDEEQALINSLMDVDPYDDHLHPVTF